MYADISRSTFRPDRHYSAVIAQQGRVQLDADANEQAAIQLWLARTTAHDLIGPDGGPAGAAGFAVGPLTGSRDLDDLTIGGGRYYVDGILCDADRPGPGDAVGDDPDGDGADGGGAAEPEPPATWTYWDQPDGFRDPERPEDRLPGRYPYLMYLKVWERSVTAAEDPELREVALGSALPDTAARTKVVWQVLPLEGSALGLGEDPDKPAVREAFRTWAENERSGRPRLAARSERPARADEDPCLTAPDARYRGPENQLYRVEVHEGGAAGEATFKWSRENGSVVFPVDGLDGTWVELASLGSDDKLDLNVGDWVECADTAYTSRGEPLPLLRVEELDLPGRRVRLSGEPDPRVGRRPELHPFLRRWDQKESSARGRKGAAGRFRGGAAHVEEGRWLPLEDGVEVYFEAGGGRYRSGDHWIVPARTATGSVEWPVNAARRPLLRPPAGITAHYAPLAWVTGEGTIADLRMVFGPLGVPVPPASEAELAAEARAEAEARAAEAAEAAETEDTETEAARAGAGDGEQSASSGASGSSGSSGSGTRATARRRRASSASAPGEGSGEEGGEAAKS
ncbi:DUF6519 domain-containing protein [Streptomyces sp. S07_1.15]|uniref:DUF6519 domain-containing protein n=1 Tax=Streptomyces sp. S07_1.15 TaxID=2873925 RepID=UPI001D14754A|nr:DUF6519 domain-containing protein [Streptomyces sp. S07_1.15]MCC3652176.1 DUF6519 domain-containing protein [Streptomyces sp. S07_1.15]